MSDPVYRAFLRRAARDAEQINANSDVVRLSPDPAGGAAPSTYAGVFAEGIAHFAPPRDVLSRPRDISPRPRDATPDATSRREGAPRVSTDAIPFLIRLPHDYLRSHDPNLQFRVVRTLAPLLHPNVHGGLVCLGPLFYPGTPLLALIEQVYGIVSSQIFATQDAFSRSARDFYLEHVDRVSEMAGTAPPLWRRAVAARVRVASIGPAT